MNCSLAKVFHIPLHMKAMIDFVFIIPVKSSCRFLSLAVLGASDNGDTLLVFNVKTTDEEGGEFHI